MHLLDCQGILFDAIECLSHFIQSFERISLLRFTM
jgi:hypothetical protein